MERLSINDVYSLAVGSSILGSGGGGNPFLGYRILKAKMIEMNIDYLEYTNEVMDSDFIIGVGGMGSPLIGVEKIPSGHEYYNSLMVLAGFIGKEPTKITPIEIGGINSIVPFIVSLMAKKPVVDGDFEGRAFPELYMTTMHFAGFRATPMSICDERGNCTVLDLVDDYYAEKVARDITVRFGGRGYISLYPCDGNGYINGGILGTVSLSYKLGGALVESGLDEMLGLSNGRVIFEGKVVDIKRYNLGGFALGVVELEGIEGYKDERAEVIFKNEYLGFIKNGEISYISPEIISLIDYSNHVVTSDSIKYGIKVRVVYIPVSNKWKEVGGYGVIRDMVYKEIMRIRQLL
ncbi:DUF917 domain-containing protein [Acidianus manzaensis]|uniref:DUF917 domain-containing protein n=1 Tax=Acidianus manzaensis TaxID=282676 RepID=A0A1W6K3U9_9CREN|nr:DUF917 domain-containing protein [Acidianus manzaensis]ARM77209.1 hypothetical protein B6F84_13550 [Acidianus manzaensis]